MASEVVDVVSQILGRVVVDNSFESELETGFIEPVSGDPTRTPLY